MSRLSQYAFAACFASASGFSMYSLQDLGNASTNVTLVDSTGHATDGGFEIPAFFIGGSVSPSLTADLANGQFIGRPLISLLFSHVTQRNPLVFSSGIFFATNGTSIVRFDQKTKAVAFAPVAGGTLRHIAYDYKGPAANAPGHSLYGYFQSHQMVLSLWHEICF